MELDQPGLPPAVVQERSLAMALLRQLEGLIPYANNIPVPWVFHFDGTDPSGRTVLTPTRLWASGTGTSWTCRSRRSTRGWRSR